MRNKIQLIPSGISLIDNAWGGFYRGGTYLLIGPRKSGRTLMALQFALECVRQKEICLFFTSMRPKDLLIQAASINFDLQSYMNQNKVIVVRVSSPIDDDEIKNNDDFLADYLKDIVAIVDQYQPNKIVFDEITSFIGFNNLRMLEEAFLQTTEKIEDEGITTVFLLGDPATQGAKDIVDVLASNSTGILYLQKRDSAAGMLNGGSMTITPNVGHTEGQFMSEYSIEPNQGITFEEQSHTEFKKHSPAPLKRKKESKYKSLSEIELPQEGFSFSNIYSVNDFLLILNNQIALFKTTGQIFTLISFRLDSEAEKRGLLTVNQLLNSVRLATDKKDKICTIENKVIVLVTKEDPSSIESIIMRVKSVLPAIEADTLNEIMNYISVFYVKVDESVQNSEDILKKLHVNNSEEKNKMGTY
jgi:KaiC/GvpD/RAD55 family RecA-like ATPase